MSAEFIIGSTVFWIVSLILLGGIYLEIVQIRKLLQHQQKLQESETEETEEESIESPGTEGTEIDFEPAPPESKPTSDPTVRMERPHN